jgi:hypothetical protein
MENNQTKTSFDSAMELAREFSTESIKYLELYINYRNVCSHLTGTILGMIQHRNLSEYHKILLIEHLKEAYEYGGVEMSEYASNQISELEK